MDWSQNHAVTAADALDAVKMLVVGYGVTAKRIKPTSYPNLFTRTLVCHDRCPGTCLASAEKFNNDPTFQTIGFKGLKRVLAERGLHIGKN